jgi:hypothetical protein
MEKGQHECCGFACARLGKTEDIPTLGGMGNHLGLNGCGLGIAFCGDSAQDWLGKTEPGE